jgi:hypothetical protein
LLFIIKRERKRREIFRSRRVYVGEGKVKVDGEEKKASRCSNSTRVQEEEDTNVPTFLSYFGLVDERFNAK